MIAYILAGGKGSRLEPWHAPKPLLPVNGIPILHRLLHHLSGKVEDVVVCTGYRAADIEASIREERWDFDHFAFSNAGEDATMIERLLKAPEPGGLKQALVCYGDELANPDIQELIKDHKRSKAFMTMTVHEERLPFGVYREGKIVEGLPVKVNIGFAVVEPQAWKYAEGCSGLSDFFNKLTWCVDGMSSVNVYEHTGRRATINNPSDIAKAEDLFK